MNEINGYVFTVLTTPHVYVTITTYLTPYMPVRKIGRVVRCSTLTLTVHVSQGNKTYAVN